MRISDWSSDVCSSDLPAAIEQLRIVAGSVGVEFFPSEVGQKPVDIARAALAEARKQYADVLIVDTAGRTTVDEEMMTEIAALHAALDRSEEHTSELQSLMRISYAVFCLKKKKIIQTQMNTVQKH